jgi:hypothetical protein
MMFNVSRFSLAGEELRKDVQLDSQSPFVSSDAEKQPANAPWTWPSFGASPAGDVYATPGAEYQVLAIAPDDEPKWAMRVAYAPEGLSEEIIGERRGIHAPMIGHRRVDERPCLQPPM